MKYYTYGYETYDNKKGEITVKAKTEADAWKRLSDYEVSRGELHYAWLKSVNDAGEEKYYKNDDAEKALALFIALAGGAITETQMYDKGFRGKTTAIFNDDTMWIINNL